MNYRILGKSGVEVSSICLGCLNFGDPSWRPWILDPLKSEEIIRHAVEQGINFFDTADAYSNGASETILGDCLRKFSNLNEVVIATKVFLPTGNGPNQQGLSRKHIVQACEASLKRLGVERIDLYTIHRLDPYTSIEETLRALELLFAQGKIGAIGASSMRAWEFMRLLAACDALNMPRFVSMQNHYNLIYREEEREMLPLCEAEGISVNPYSPLARGILAKARSEFMSPTQRWQFDTARESLYSHPSDADILNVLNEQSQHVECSQAQLALSWLLHKPSICSPIVGVSSLSQLDELIRACEYSMNQKTINALEAAYEPHAVRGYPPSPKRFSAL